MTRSQLSHAYWNRRYWRMLETEQQRARELSELQELLLLVRQQAES